MNEQMEFPETFEKFAKEYGFKDDKEVYTNGSYLIPIFRVKQWLEHDTKLRAIETDTQVAVIEDNSFNLSKRVMTIEEAIVRIKDHMIIHKMNEPRAILISEALNMVIKALEQRPRWVPVSERLPKKSGNYWCTFSGTYLTGRDYYITESDAKKLFDDHEEYAGWQSQNVVAWMPLPEHYKVEKEE